MFYGNSMAQKWIFAHIWSDNNLDLRTFDQKF